MYRYTPVASTYSSPFDMCGGRTFVITRRGKSLDIATRGRFNFGASVSCVSTSSIALNTLNHFRYHSQYRHFSFGDDYAMLEARVLKALCKAVGPGQALSTVYGGFTAITRFGPNAINSFLLPLAMGYWKKWESLLEKTNDSKKRLELQMCQQAVLVSGDESWELIMFGDNSHSDFSQLKQESLAVLFADDHRISQEEWEELEDTFGDQLVLITGLETDYALMAV